MDKILPGSKASVEKVDVVEAEPVPSPSPENSAASSSSPSTMSPSVQANQCEYNGDYIIAPLIGACGKTYLARTSKKCTGSPVELKLYRQVKKRPNVIRWSLKSKKGVTALVPKGCKKNALAAPSDPRKLKIGGTSWKWTVAPVSAGDCSKVTLLSKSKKYLSVSNGCDFTYSKTAGKAEQFVLKLKS